jgi:hypothetical protein
VAAPDFLFEINLSGPVASTEMLSDLAGQVFEHVGCPRADLSAMMDEVHAAMAACASAGDASCGVRFRAQAGELAIEVTSSGGGRIWHASRRMA